MQISRATEYALLGLAYLARSEKGNASTREIAESEKLSSYFLRNVFQKLRTAGIVKAHQGKGYTLAKKAPAISLKMAVEAVEGKVSIHKCLNQKNLACKHSRNCKIIAKWDLLQQKFLAELEKIRLNEIL